VALSGLTIFLYWPLILLLLYPLTYVAAILDGLINWVRIKNGENFSEQQYYLEEPEPQQHYLPASGNNFASQVMWLEQEG
jgi:hypothetical protein